MTKKRSFVYSAAVHDEGLAERSGAWIEPASLECARQLCQVQREIATVWQVRGESIRGRDRERRPGLDRRIAGLHFPQLARLHKCSQMTYLPGQRPALVKGGLSMRQDNPGITKAHLTDSAPLRPVKTKSIHC